MPQPLLDACLIVKDEEDNLPRCLAALDRLRPLIENVHIYDTGSTDDTVALARAVGCRVVEGYWDGDFARARNASLDMSDAEWALVVDADEEIEADPARLASALGRLRDVDVVTAPYLHVDEQGRPQATSTYIKLVRRRDVTFCGPIHERAERADGRRARSTLFGADLMHVVHWGYASPDVRRRKAGRNLESARVAVERARSNGRRPGLADALGHLGRTLALLGEHDAAAEHLGEAMGIAPAGSEAWCVFAQQLVGTLIAGSRRMEAAEVVRQVQGTPGAGLLARVLLSDVVAATGDRAGAYRLLDEAPDAGDVEHGVEPNALAARRWHLAQALGRQDEVLARILVAVTAGGRYELSPTLMAIWGDQPASKLAALLRASSPSEQLPALRRHLARAGGVGAEAASLL